MDIGHIPIFFVWEKLLYFVVGRLQYSAKLVSVHTYLSRSSESFTDGFSSCMHKFKKSLEIDECDSIPRYLLLLILLVLQPLLFHGDHLLVLRSFLFESTLFLFLNPKVLSTTPSFSQPIDVSFASHKFSREGKFVVVSLLQSILRKKVRPLSEPGLLSNTILACRSSKFIVSGIRLRGEFSKLKVVLGEETVSSRHRWRVLQLSYPNG